MNWRSAALTFVTVALLLAMASLLTAEAWSDSLTVDEGFDLEAGMCAFTNGFIDNEATHPAGFRLLAGGVAVLAGPRVQRRCAGIYDDTTYPPSPELLRRLVLVARLPIIAVSLFLALGVFLWARALFGAPAGLIALAAFAFEPTVLGHGHLVTADMGVTAGLTGALAAHWTWRSTGRRRWLVVGGLALGWALLCKVSAIYLLPVLVVLELARGHGDLWARARSAVAPVATFVGVAWATVCLAYLPFKYHLPAHHRWGPPVSWLLPPSWIYGLQWQIRHVAKGGEFYLNGETAMNHGWWQYYLEAAALKTTIGLLVLTVIGGVLLARSRNRVAALYLGLPLIVFFAAPTISGADLGVRYILPAYPLMAIVAGSIVQGFRRVQAGRWAIASLCVLASVASSLSQFPSHIGYFNEAAGRQPERYLSDSNVDWGQDAWRLRDWWESQGRPPIADLYFGALPLSSYGITDDPVSFGTDGPRAQPDELVVVSISNLTVLGNVPPGLLRGRKEVARVGTSLLVYGPANPLP